MIARNIEIENSLSESFEKVTISDREMIKQIKQVIPWESEESILREMKRLQYNFSDIVEYFIANSAKESDPNEEENLITSTEDLTESKTNEEN